MQKMQALLRGTADKPELCCPQVGLFCTDLRAGDEIQEGSPLGILLVLNRRYEITAPRECSATVATKPARGARAMGYGEPLFELTSQTSDQRTAGNSVADDVEQDSAEGLRSIHAPIDGIYYARSAPEAPPYVQVGDPVSEGQTVGLIEVMKTFNPIRYEAVGGRAARVAAIQVEDQQEVTAGQSLLLLEFD